MKRSRLAGGDASSSTLAELLGATYGGAASDYLLTPGPARSVVDLDFTTLPTADYSGDTAGTDTIHAIDGVNWTWNRHSSATTWGILNGTGLQVDGAGSSYIEVDLATLLGAYDPEQDALSIELALSGIASGWSNGLIRLADSANTDNIAAQLPISGDYLWRLTTKNGGAQVTTSAAGQAAAPGTARCQLDVAEPMARLRADMAGGSTLGDLDSLPVLLEASRVGQVGGAGGSLAISSPLLRISINAGAAGASVVRLRISRLRRL